MINSRGCCSNSPPKMNQRSPFLLFGFFCLRTLCVWSWTRLVHFHFNIPYRGEGSGGLPVSVEYWRLQGRNWAIRCEPHYCVVETNISFLPSMVGLVVDTRTKVRSAPTILARPSHNVVFASGTRNSHQLAITILDIASCSDILRLVLQNYNILFKSSWLSNILIIWKNKITNFGVVII